MTPEDSPTSLPKWLLPSIVVCALLSMWSISKRMHVEEGNKSVSMAVEYETLEGLAAAQGMPITRAFSDIKAQGATSIVVSEETVSELVQQGRLTLTSTGYTSPDPETTARVDKGLKIRFGRTTNLTPSLMRQTAVGLNPEQTRNVQAAKMTIIARCSNPPGISATGVFDTLKWANDLGATVFLPQGDQVLGRRDAVNTTVDTLKMLNMLYATPEFAKIGGDDKIVEGAKENVVRLHSAQVAELDKMPEADAVERYSKAARERNMRILLIRPLSYASEQPLASFAEFLKKIDLQLRKDGDVPGAAKPFEDSNVPKWLVLLIGLSIVPVACFVGMSLVKNRNAQIAGIALAVLLGAASYSHSGKPFTALMAAIVFPIAGFLILDFRRGKSQLLEFLIVSAVSLVGGLAVAGLLNGLTYFLHLDEFKAVKLAVFLPIIVVGIYLLAKLTNLKEEIRNPMTWAAALTTLVLLGAMMFMLSRTGNDNPAGVSDFELKFRNVLDAVLFVRPRTKSFLVGHPLLFAGIGLLLWRRRTGSKDHAILTVLLLTGGAVGQTDMVNTLCHLHTPILLSIERDVVGLVAGCIIGLILWFCVKKGLRLQEGRIVAV